MRHPRLTLVPILTALWICAAFSQSPPDSLKSLQERTTVLPFVGELSTIKLTPTDQVPKELYVTFTDKVIQIRGRKRKDTALIMGRLCGHFGKIVLIPPKPSQSGTITVGVPFMEDNTSYGIALELQDNTLSTKVLKLVPKVTYTWLAQSDQGKFIITVMDNHDVVGSLEAPQTKVMSFGFTATVRYIKNVADFSINFDPSNKIIKQAQQGAAANP